MSDTLQSPDPLANARVLIVDDVPKNLQVLGQVLRDEGYEVIPATSGEQALKSADAHKPDLILLDVMMPEMNGYEVIEKLKSDHDLQDIPVIFVTALTDEEDEQKGLELGAVDYITKPLNLPITRSRTRTHLQLKKARQTLEEQNQQLIEAAALREDVERITHHDLKNPLAVILGAPDVMSLEDNLSEKQTKMLGMIRSSGYRMLEMIDRSLDLYKMETGVYTFHPVTVNIHEVLDKICGEVGSLLADKSISLEILLGGEEVGEGSAFEVKAEPLLCYSMLANLIKNAIEASPENGTIQIDLQSGKTPAVSISNQGSVPEEIRDRFFGKYVTSGKKKGTGLGTYSARLIAETLGGTIELDSSGVDATTITVTLKSV